MTIARFKGQKVIKDIMGVISLIFYGIFKKWGILSLVLLMVFGRSLSSTQTQVVASGKDITAQHKNNYVTTLQYRNPSVSSIQYAGDGSEKEKKVHLRRTKSLSRSLPQTSSHQDTSGNQIISSLTSSSTAKIYLFDIQRYFNPDTNDHFYTMGTAEIDFQKNVMKDKFWSSYQKEIVAFLAPRLSDAAILGENWKKVRRFLHPSKGHFYTIDEADAQYAINHGWIEEDPPEYLQFCASDKPGPRLLPIVRYLGEHDHFYVSALSNAKKTEYLQQSGYKYEKVAFYAFDATDSQPYQPNSPRFIDETSDAASYHDSDSSIVYNIQNAGEIRKILVLSVLLCILAYFLVAITSIMYLHVFRKIPIGALRHLALMMYGLGACYLMLSSLLFFSQEFRIDSSYK